MGDNPRGRVDGQRVVAGCRADELGFVFDMISTAPPGLLPHGDLVSIARLSAAAAGWHSHGMASYSVNPLAVARAQRLIDARQYVLDSDWGDVQPRAETENAFLKTHSWDEYAEWHLGLTRGATDQTKARYAFVYGDFRRVHRTGLIACVYRAAEWRHKEVELAAHELLQRLDRTSA
jgi:hypothetical protein